MPRRRRPSNDTDEQRWVGATTLFVLSNESHNHVLQMVGLNSETRTVFCRIIVDDIHSENSHVILRISIRRIVELVIAMEQGQQSSGEKTMTENDVPTCVSNRAKELLRLGAVWILDPSSVDRPQNRPKWNRHIFWSNDDLGALHECNNDNDNDNQQELHYQSGMIVRIHCRPSRFAPLPTTLDSNRRLGTIQDTIIFEDTILGYAVINKTDGLPCHGTVDNATENVLYYYQQHLVRNETKHRPPIANLTSKYRRLLPYASLPHRLDIETSGLLLIASNKGFASYASKLFQKDPLTVKTSRHSPSTMSIQKYYRCLVYSTHDQWRKIVNRQGDFITHFLDNSSSAAPKTFVSKIPEEDQHQERDSLSTTCKKKWLECQLRLYYVGPPISWQEVSSHNFNGTYDIVFQVEVELLTGRTHQIRGQMAALGCPIVGDPLYGNISTKHPIRNRNDGLETADASSLVDALSSHCNRMALQCCQLAFPRPDDPKRLLRFVLEKAWWTELLSPANAKPS